MLFAVFLIAAALVTCATRLSSIRERRVTGFRPEGVAFVATVLLTTLGGTWFSSGGLPQQQKLMVSGTIVLLTGVLYALSALRGAKRLPVWVADALVIIIAAIAVYGLGQPVVEGLRLPFSNAYVNLYGLAAPLTILWVWALTRMTAALNRTPEVTGGYLGIVALTLLVAAQLGATSGNLPHSALPGVACAALAGAGLASVPVALRLPGFNLGWSAALAMGFLLAQISIIGLSKNLAFAILTLFLLVFGLPLLDVSFYKVRAARRGQNVSWEEKRLRLHEVLIRRGISPAKVSLLYLAIATSLCILGMLLIATASWNFILRAVLLFAILFAGFILFFSLTRVLMRRAADEEIPESVEAFGVRVSPVSMSEAMDNIESYIQSGKPHHVVTSDANAMLRAQEDEEYAGILRRAAMITPDGYGVLWGARLLNLPIYERVTGVDMVTGICERAAKQGYTIYIFGSSPGVAATAAQKLAERYPGLKVVGTHHGMVLKDPEALAKVVREIRAARPDVLFVALGIPLQEKFIAQHMEEMQVPVSLGVGGSFDVYSEKLKRAPDYIQRVGMEWLYRVWQEPWRWKRMSYVPRFMAFALREWLFGPSRDRRNRDTNNPNPSKAAS